VLAKSLDKDTSGRVPPERRWIEAGINWIGGRNITEPRTVVSGIRRQLSKVSATIPMNVASLSRSLPLAVL